MKKVLIAAAALLVAACSSMPSWVPGSGWTTLLDGDKGMENFNKIGHANWRAEGGVIVADKSPGTSYLVSKQSFKDFVLLAEFWADKNTNSGVFIRVKNPKKIGSDSAYEMNIYDARARPDYATGAIVNFAKAPASPVKVAGKWNTCEITAKGSTVTVMLNGQKTAELHGAKLLEGPVALQFGNHGKVPGGAIKFRKVQVKPL